MLAASFVQMLTIAVTTTMVDVASRARPPGRGPATAPRPIPSQAAV